MSSVRAVFGDRFLRRPARKRSLEEHLAVLEKSGEALQARAARAAATDANRAHLRHIISSERWGQRRLGTILGQPPIADESDS